MTVDLTGADEQEARASSGGGLGLRGTPESAASAAPTELDPVEDIKNPFDNLQPDHGWRRRVPPAEWKDR